MHLRLDKNLNLLPHNLAERINVYDGAVRAPLPLWAESLVLLGAWCRRHQIKDKRLIVFAVLPTRTLAAAFAAFGSLLAGASEFEDSLSWPTFRKLETGSNVFWKTEDGKRAYAGSILGFKETGGVEYIVVRVTKAPRKIEMGSVSEISEDYFDRYRFTGEKPPSVPKSASFGAANQFIGEIVDNLNPKWIWTDGADGLLVTSISKFDNSLVDLALSVGTDRPVALSQLLCLGRNDQQSHAKFRIDHPKGVLSGKFPLTILDGTAAFGVHEHLSDASNILVILDRTEYQQEIHDAALLLRSISKDVAATELDTDLPVTFPPGIEIAAYIIKKRG